VAALQCDHGKGDRALKRRRLALVGGLLVAGAAVGACAKARPSATPETKPAIPRPRSAPVFEFHSDPWVNLHERLLAEATVGPYWHSPVETCACARGADGSVLPEWASAVARYKKTFAERNHYSDSSLVETTLVLALAGGKTELPSGVDKDLAAPLATTFDAYFRRTWSADDARNKAWIRTVEPLVATWGEEIATELANRFETQWPNRPVRVEVTQFAGFGGAYTTNDSVILTTMSSDDSGYVGPAALEMLFHEASHGLIGVLNHDLQMAFIARGRRPPASLEHVIIFYTAGELVRRRFGPDYVPYGYKQGVYKRGWDKLEPAVRTHWQSWLDDTIDLPTALDRLVEAFPEEAIGRRPTDGLTPRRRVASVAACVLFAFVSRSSSSPLARPPCAERTWAESSFRTKRSKE
jgi:hypothetical protein